MRDDVQESLAVVIMVGLLIWGISCHYDARMDYEGDKLTQCELGREEVNKELKELRESLEAKMGHWREE